MHHKRYTILFTTSTFHCVLFTNLHNIIAKIQKNEIIILIHKYRGQRMKTLIKNVQIINLYKMLISDVELTFAPHQSQYLASLLLTRPHLLQHRRRPF